MADKTLAALALVYLKPCVVWFWSLSFSSWTSNSKGPNVKRLAPGGNHQLDLSVNKWSGTVTGVRMGSFDDLK